MCFHGDHIAARTMEHEVLRTETERETRHVVLEQSSIADEEPRRNKQDVGDRS